MKKDKIQSFWYELPEDIKSKLHNDFVAIDRKMQWTDKQYLINYDRYLGNYFEAKENRLQNKWQNQPRWPIEEIEKFE